MSTFRALRFQWFEAQPPLTVGKDSFTVEALSGPHGHAVVCTGPQPWRRERRPPRLGPFSPVSGQLTRLGPDRIGFFQSYIHNHSGSQGRFFGDVFSLRGAHIAALGELDLSQTALGPDHLWIIEQAGDADAQGLTIEGVELETGRRIGPITLDTQAILRLGTPISQRRWSEVYGSSASFWALNWQGDHPWLTIRVLRPGKRPVRKRYHLPLETALSHLADPDRRRD